ncbi:MAG: hypothetical protein HON90_16380 [Halobacteriovoraceae bacterium]|nr:hypothetical protein [Halobacteriovoraceae bacterium]
MKLITFTVLAAMSTQATIAAPMSPMENYTATNVAGSEVSRIWEGMETDLKGKDCYRRAQIWAYDMHEQMNINSKKIFIHYTDKFNRELDQLGDIGWMKRKFFKAKKLDRRINKLVRTNITWDYHVAPMISVDGSDLVMDRYLELPYDAPKNYTAKQAWSLKAKPATPESWVEALTVRGELLWQARRASLLQDIKKAKKQSRFSSNNNDADDFMYSSNSESSEDKLKKLQATFKKLGMDKSDRIDIKCEKVDSIAEVDMQHDTAWCFYSVAPMYYYNEIDLRSLAYGDSQYNYVSAPPKSVQTEKNYQDGRSYIQTRFNQDELIDADKERKVHDDQY